MYESKCTLCLKQEERGAGAEMEKEEGERSRRGKVDYKEKGIYVGESSRSLYERVKEHIRDGKSQAEDSHIGKHWQECHRGEEMPLFKFKIVGTYKDSLSRQIAESVRIDMRVEVLNSKSVYSRNRLPRLEVEKTEWEKEDEERRKNLLARKEREEERGGAAEKGRLWRGRIRN